MLSLLLSSFFLLSLDPSEADSLRQGGVIDEVVVAADPKTIGDAASQPVSYTVVSAAPLRSAGNSGLKDVMRYTPNLFMPDYGSQLTSAIYIRGIGSRINNPAVGVYVDDVACQEKAAFDASFDDVTRVDVLRGPQSTLYGRNAMGGLLRLYTFNPITTLTEGGQTLLRLGTSTRDAGRWAYVRTAQPLGADAALGVSAFYRGNDGYNRNAYLHRRSNGEESGGGRLRAVWNPHRGGFTLDAQTSLQLTDEDGYDYRSADTHRIEEGLLGNYRRTLASASLRLSQEWTYSTLTSVSSWQHVHDRMFMDQDFSPADVFTLLQRQNSHHLSEELTLKGNSSDRRLGYVAGFYVAHQSLTTTAPVVFGEEGISSLLQSGINSGFAAANAAMSPMGMSLGLTLTDPTMEVSGRFRTPMDNAAAFGQLSYESLFGVQGLTLTAGLRLDYEHTLLRYSSAATSNYQFQLKRGAVAMVDKAFSTTSSYDGRLSSEYTRLLPKATVSYSWKPRQLIYASLSTGLRSGGYNIQMFSDLIQTSLRNDMMSTLAADPQLAAQMKRFVTIGTNPAADSTTVYRPERSVNIEVGTHLALFDDRLNLTAAAFLINTRNQQLSRFAANGLGRQMVNAGSSRSWGWELAASTTTDLFRHPLTLHADWGFTHATFLDYDCGESRGVAYDYDGRRVPFVPNHTLAVGADYALPIGSNQLRFGADLTGAGRIYWTEDNSHSQPFYLLLGAHATLQHGNLALNLWGRNLTSTHYTPFYFESMSRGFSQVPRPLQLGAELVLSF